MKKYRLKNGMIVKLIRTMETVKVVDTANNADYQLDDILISYHPRLGELFVGDFKIVEKIGDHLTDDELIREISYKFGSFDGLRFFEKLVDYCSLAFTMLPENKQGEVINAVKKYAPKIFDGLLGKVDKRGRL
jgi:hypothetical protein